MADISQTTFCGIALDNLTDPEAVSSIIDDAVFLNTDELAALVENTGTVVPELLGNLRETQLELVQSYTRDKSQQAQEKLARLIGGISADHWPKIFEGLKATLAHPHVHRF